MLGSASYLSLSLVCTFGTPVADMLAHSPPLPLVIDYFFEGCSITAEDEEGIQLALQRGRVRRIRLRMPAPNPNMQKFIKAIDGEYPLLEYLILVYPTEGQSTALMLPETLQAPHLRHLALDGVILPIGSQLLTTAVGIVTLLLFMEYPSTYFQPNTLLQLILFMPKLETLVIDLSLSEPNTDVETQLVQTPTGTKVTVTLPNLRWFWFGGVSTYLEEVVSRITTPRLERLDVQFLEQLIFPVPCLLQFIDTAKNLRFDSVKFELYECISVEIYLHGAKTHALAITLNCWPIHWQVSCVAQIFNSLGQISSTVEHLTFECRLYPTRYSYSSEEYNDRPEWRKLLRSFSNAKTLFVDDRLLEKLSCCLRLEDEELPLELLPKLQELTYSGRGNTGDAFTQFIDARKNAGCPVTLTCRTQESVVPSTNGY